MTFIQKLRSFDDDLNFRRAFKVSLVVSATLVALSLLCLGTRGLNLGVDFKGGTVWEVPNPHLTSAAARNAVGGNPSAITIQTLTHSVRIETGTKSQDTINAVTGKLATAAGVSAENINVSAVGPSWGSEVSSKALKALIFFFIAIAVYISARFEWRMAVSAILAVMHDIIISTGLYALLQIEVTPGTVIAFLTILGYSLYDTIVVFDKIRDNVSHLGATGRSTYTDIANLSVNQTMMRSINTTLSALLPVISILVIGAGVMGAVTLEEFGYALLVGLFVGAYSSIFVATPILVFQKEREPRYAALRTRLEGREARTRVATSGLPVEADTSMGLDREVDTEQGGSAVATATLPKPKPKPGTYSSNHPPRPRKKGKKR